MRLYNAASCTPVAIPSSGAKWSPPSSFLPGKPVKQPAGAGRACYDGSLDRQVPRTSHKVHHDNETPPRLSYSYWLGLDQKKTPDAKASRMVPRSTTDTTATSQTDEDMPLQYSSSDFSEFPSFDIDVVLKRDERAAGVPGFVGIDEDFLTRASSSTISTHSLEEQLCGLSFVVTEQQPTTSEQISGHRRPGSPFARPSLDAGTSNSYGFIPPCKVERKRLSTAEHVGSLFAEPYGEPFSPAEPGKQQECCIHDRKEDAGPSMDEWTLEDDISWVNFFNEAFKPIDKPSQPPEKAKMLACPKPKVETGFVPFPKGEEHSSFVSFKEVGI